MRFSFGFDRENKREPWLTPASGPTDTTSVFRDRREPHTTDSTTERSRTDFDVGKESARAVLRRPRRARIKLLAPTPCNGIGPKTV